MKRLIAASFTCALTFAACTACAKPSADIPLPMMAVPKTVEPPTIDGRLSPGEWDHAAAATAFVTAFKNELSKAQTVAWITWDDKYLYVALKNYRGPENKYKLLSIRGRKPDDGSIVFDTSNEIWFTPPSLPQETYQTMFNAYPGFFDVKMIPSLGNQSKSWSAGWSVASSETEDYWIIEARARIDAYTDQKIEDETTWRGLFTTDVIGGAGFTAWAPGGAFADIPRHGKLVFRTDAPAVQLLDVATVRTGNFEIPVAVTGTAEGKSTVTVQLRFSAGLKEQESDKVLEQTFEVAAGERREHTFEGTLDDLDLPIDERTKHPTGFCAVTAETEDGKPLYSQTFAFDVDGYIRKAPAEILRTPYGDDPFGMQLNFAPLSRVLICKIDRYYTENAESVQGGTLTVTDPDTGEIVAQREIAPFYYDYSEFPVDLQHLDIPVMTDADWKAQEEVRKKNQPLPEEERQPLPFQPSVYDVTVALHDNSGSTVAERSTDVKLSGFESEWLGTSIGMGEEAIPPWTPIEADTGLVTSRVKGPLRMWNKEYTLNALGLPEKIINDGAPQLSGPIRLEAVVSGSTQTVEAGAPKLDEKLSDNAGVARLEGAADLGDLEFFTETRVEMDGFVYNKMTITPDQPVQLDRLSVVVRMPKSEGQLFVTTAGGWTSTYGWTPERWTSKETSSGGRTVNFVPYTFLTDSDRGFCMFADNEKGWILDPDAATQEIMHDGDEVVLRWNLATRSGTVSEPFTVEYGWMCTPQKPQPEQWRRWSIGDSKPHHKLGTFSFLAPHNSNWYFVFPYYASPFPKGGDYETLKGRLAPRSGAESAPFWRPSPGNIMHSIGRYVDAKGRWFGSLRTEWDETPSGSGLNQIRTRGTNDFQVWHYDQAVKRAGMKGLYFDEPYLSEDYNYLNGGAYLLPDERIQPGYNFLGMREFSMRKRRMFHANGVKQPNLWYHATAQHPVYAWLCDVNWEGENVMPGGYEKDYMVAHSAARMRSIGMGRNLGSIPVVFCQAWKEFDEDSPVLHFLVQQLIGWAMAHDCMPSHTTVFWNVLAPELELWREGTTFNPYWKSNHAVNTSSDDIIVSAHARKDDVVLWIVNKAREDRQATVNLNYAALDVNPERLVAMDIETGQIYPVSSDEDGVGVLTVQVPKRLWRAVRLISTPALKGDVSFIATFDDGTADADAAYGCRFAEPTKRWRENDRWHTEVPDPEAVGKTGKGMTLEYPLSYFARLNTMPDSSTVTFNLNVDLSTQGQRMSLFGVGALQIYVQDGKIMVHEKVNKRWQTLDEADLPEAVLHDGWHAVTVAWSGGKVSLRIDDHDIPLENVDVTIGPWGRGLFLEPSRRRWGPAKTLMTFGPMKEAIIDDIVMTR